MLAHFNEKALDLSSFTEFGDGFTEFAKWRLQIRIADKYFYSSMSIEDHIKCV